MVYNSSSPFEQQAFSNLNVNEVMDLTGVGKGLSLTSSGKYGCRGC